MQRSEKLLGMVQVSVMALTTLWLTGCASTTPRKNNAAAYSTQMAAVEVQIERAHLTATIDALENLINQPAPDLRPQFEAYGREVDRLYDSIEDVESAVKRMQR